MMNKITKIFVLFIFLSVSPELKIYSQWRCPTDIIRCQLEKSMRFNVEKNIMEKSRSYGKAK